jgi:metal-responsive CopG/Arc/MetJ family transcriptional regulator
MSSYRRTQMYLTEEMLRELKSRAEEEKCSVSDIVRNAVKDFLQNKRKKDWDRDPLWEIVGAAATEDGDLSTRHDRYLYGKEP